jgi:hypothetical protein
MRAAALQTRRTHKSQEVLRQNGFETGFWPDPAMPQSGARRKKPRTGRGFRQLPFAYSQFEVNVLAVLLGFEHSVHLTNFWVSVDTLYLPLTPLFIRSLSVYIALGIKI